MKVLSDNTAAKVLRLVSGRGTPPPHATPRPAPTTPPAPMWQIHVSQSGNVSVDGGDVYGCDGLTHITAASLGHADGGECVVWREDGLSLEAEPDEGDFRLIGRVVKDDSGTYHAEQLFAGPIEATWHFGLADGAEERSAWDVSAGRPAVLKVDMPAAEGGEGGKIEVLVDSRGNIVRWGVYGPGGGGGVTDKKPECGNPLNDHGNTGKESDNPLDNPRGGGMGQEGVGDPTPQEESDNPLDHVADNGGWTPECSQPK